MRKEDDNQREKRIGLFPRQTSGDTARAIGDKRAHWSQPYASQCVESRSQVRVSPPYQRLRPTE